MRTYSAKEIEIINQENLETAVLGLVSCRVTNFTGALFPQAVPLPINSTVREVIGCLIADRGEPVAVDTIIGNKSLFDIFKELNVPHVAERIVSCINDAVASYDPVVNCEEYDVFDEVNYKLRHRRMQRQITANAQTTSVLSEVMYSTADIDVEEAITNIFGDAVASVWNKGSVNINDNHGVDVDKSIIVKLNNGKYITFQGGIIS